MPASQTSNEDGISVASGGKQFLFDYTRIDRSNPVADRAGIEKWNPHRGLMHLLDTVYWVDEAGETGLGVKHVRADEFWVPGHFPGKPLYPGVLQIESGAQLACFIFILRKCGPKTPAFLRIENAAFRMGVVPGDDLLLLCKGVKAQRRRFITDVQGVVNGKIAFDARVSGMILEG